MMKTFTKMMTLGVLLLFACTMQLSAQNCSFSKDETDKFTNNRVLHTKPVNLIVEKIKVKDTYTVEKLEMQVKYENNRFLLSLSYHFALGKSMANTSSKLILLLSDGSKIEIPCIQDIPSIEYKKNGVAIFSYNFEMSMDDLMTLSKADITDVRMAAFINPIEFSVSNNIKTSELFNCIKNNK